MVAYVIVAMPLATPLTMPVPAPTDAIEMLLLVHVPPPVASLSVIVAGKHSGALPVIPAGIEVTVTIVVAAQPVAVNA